MMNTMKTMLLVLAAVGALSGCAQPGVRTVEKFRAARAAGDLETARSFLAPDPRTWYESREGDGTPWEIGGRGRWADWDEEFHSQSDPDPWQVGDHRVFSRVEEMNDYYRLIERGPGVYLHTYFLDDEGRIAGQMISAPSDWEPPPSRFDEFEAWARANDPEELEYLRPGGRLDPTGDRAQRTRALANRWRRSVGLAPIESTSNTTLDPVATTFPTPDGGVIHADAYGTGKHAVVLVHGGRFDKTSWSPQARALAREGFRVLAIDLRGYGASHGGGESDRYDLDVVGAVRHLRTTGAQTVSVIGASFGGWAAASAAAGVGRGEIDRLVLLAHSPIDHPERMRGRKLFVVARDDPHADGSLRLEEIRQQYERAPGPKRILILEGSEHAQHVFGTTQGPRLMEAILRFLDGNSPRS